MDLSHIRNFVIISHIDHGKSTLADRFLELTETVPKDKLRPQYLDSMALEREKGITIKMHPVRMIWRQPNHTEIPSSKHQSASWRTNKSQIQNSKSQTNNLGFSASDLGFQGSEYILNLIDTPGHIDFSYEISRALACVEGAILLVDATKGIQAQTLFNLAQAKNQNLKIIGAVNKIDSPQAQIPETKKELALILGQKQEEIFTISAKEGTNVEELLAALIDRVPPPKISTPKEAFKALIFDSRYDQFSGVIAFLRVFSGRIQKGDKIFLIQNSQEGEVKEVGYFSPNLKSCDVLEAGGIGYVKTGIKDASKVKVGDTVTSFKFQASSFKPKPLPGYKEPQLVVFLSLYPEDSDRFEDLKDGLQKLKLNDPALNFQPETKMVLGRGFRIGFLGSLHAEITIRRLKEEFDLELIATSPQVVFNILTRDESEIKVSSAALWPDPSNIKEIREPWAELEIISPQQYLEQVFKILRNFKSRNVETNFLTSQKFIVKAKAPLRKIITGNFYEKLKSATSGYASFSFRPTASEVADLVKMDVLVAGVIQEPFSRIVPQEDAFLEGKKMVKKLKEILPPQQFSLPLQAAVGGKIIARETVKAKRKDVTAPLYGGDFTRKKKLLEIQKKGKKELAQKAKIKIPSSVFLEMLRD